MEWRCTTTLRMVKNNYYRTRLREETFDAEATTIARNYNAGLEIGKDYFCWARESEKLLRDIVKKIILDLRYLVAGPCTRDRQE